ncbi:hypothetical protein ACRALDRAFT_1063655 [Sodiomyces alcalophilus JCM 7366]|uniref:uncharacterized protein n=1 Tax=Sodiomyces alcalophilus JCM 7366 TaxID=591952 RepID=UPI0039B5685C
MNNEQFRRLLGADTPKSSQGAVSKAGASTGSGSATPGALGSRQRASIPMTPRSVGTGQSDFLRQLAARDRANRQQKQFKTSAPKGSRLAQGYVDRAKEREKAKEEEDERAKRVKALEELLKEGEIDRETFDRQVGEIAGGDLSSTHLVKGLDRKLLERIRKGEDVFGQGDSSSSKDGEPEPEEEEPPPDVDEELDQLAQREVQAVAKERTEKKKGQLALAALAPGKKRTRDQIIAEMKAARAAAKAAKESGLGDKFRKIGAKQKAGTRVERDSKGREVLIIVDEDGHEKRMVRKVQPQPRARDEQDEAELERDAMMPDKNAKPLGMEVPEFYRKQQEAAEKEAEVDDIFSDAGDDYDPLAGIESDADSDSGTDADGEEKKADKVKETTTKDKVEEGEVEDRPREGMPPPPKPSETKDYFKGARTELLSEQKRDAPSLSDPAIQAAFKKAAQLGAAREKRKAGTGDDDELDEDEARKRAERRRAMLESARRDEEDLDLGFGTSRLDDEEDLDESRVKLSEWGEDDDDEGGGARGGRSKRKRGPKKRKGDVNSAADVLRVMEQRRGS